MRAWVLFVLVGVAPLAAWGEADATEAELIRLETTKWDPASLGHLKELMGLFADDMLSVEYGNDLNGGVERRTWKEILAHGPLPDWKMKLSDWRTIRPSPEVVVLSYKVTGVSVQWKAYATSIWARRNGKWQTVFYQASTAK